MYYPRGIPEHTHLSAIIRWRVFHAPISGYARFPLDPSCIVAPPPTDTIGGGGFSLGQGCYLFAN